MDGYGVSAVVVVVAADAVVAVLCVVVALVLAVLLPWVDASVSSLPASSALNVVPVRGRTVVDATVEE